MYVTQVRSDYVVAVKDRVMVEDCRASVFLADFNCHVE